MSSIGKGFYQIKLWLNHHSCTAFFPIFCVPKTDVRFSPMESIVKGDYYLMDGTLKSIDFFIGTCEPDCLDIYEVLRIQDHQPLFWADHLQRLENSINIGLKKSWLTQHQIRQKVDLLIASNSLSDGNIKLEFRYKQNGEQHFLAYYIPTRYPSTEQYQRGVSCCLFHAERTQPRAKIYNPQLRSAANELIRDKSVFETLLVDHNGFITEGSRSNVFFIRNQQLYTAPDETVLSGVIRKKVIEVIQQLGLPLSYDALHYKKLEAVEAAFITGTSLRILPLSDIETAHLNPDHPIIHQLSNELTKLIESSKQ